jgi:hypothetical protein
MKTRIHFEVLNLSKVVLNYRKNFVESCTTNFMMQTAVMVAKYRYGFRFIYNLWIDGTRGRKSGNFLVVLILLRDVSRLDL